MGAAASSYLESLGDTVTEEECRKLVDLGKVDPAKVDGWLLLMDEWPVPKGKIEKLFSFEEQKRKKESEDAQSSKEELEAVGKGVLDHALKRPDVDSLSALPSEWRDYIVPKEDPDVGRS